jgi:hypothetical protein
VLEITVGDAPTVVLFEIEVGFLRGGQEIEVENGRLRTEVDRED